MTCLVLRVILSAFVVAAHGLATPALAATDLEREARTIEDMLMAPCCFQQQVSVHQSPTATAVQKDIRARLARGETRDVILAAYVAEHGPGILVIPPAQGANWILYVLPPMVLVGSVLLIVGLVRRYTTQHDTPQTQGLKPLCSDTDRHSLDDRLTDELRDLD